MEEKETEQKGAVIDLFSLFENIRRGAARYWKIGVLLIVLCAGALALRTCLTYTPVYEAEASFTVRVVNPLYASANIYNAATAEQMEKTFPQILNSSALKEAVRKYLGTADLPSVTASAIKGTNVLTLRVRDRTPEWAYKVLCAVIENYPEVSEFVIGPSLMILLDDSGVPTVPVNSFNPVKSAVKGALIGLAAFLLLLIVFSIGRKTIHTEEELKQILNFPCLGTLPATKVVGSKRPCPMINHDMDRYGFIDAVRLMRLHTENAMRAHNRKVLLISSASPGEGKTTVAANLAVSLAKKGNLVLLIDCDVRNPSAARALGQSNKNGLADFLHGNITLRETVRPTEIHNLSLIPAGEAHENTLKQFSGGRFRQLLDAARSVYDYILLDTPPCGLLSDASEIAPAADAALMVIRQDFAPQYLILDAVRYLTDSKLPLIGCVINGMAGGLTAHGYGYGNYGYGYGGYGYGGYKNKRYGEAEDSTANRTGDAFADESDHIPS